MPRPKKTEICVILIFPFLYSGNINAFILITWLFRQIRNIKLLKSLQCLALLFLKKCRFCTLKINLFILFICVFYLYCGIILNICTKLVLILIKTNALPSFVWRIKVGIMKTLSFGLFTLLVLADCFCSFFMVNHVDKYKFSIIMALFFNIFS